ncbi:ThuA domain-containing protein [Thalassotalea sp. PLHSN55]|uniref:ThuA domain-containing protein n=1 Tax=Thalassotalea sp. PLHSN55 TaxID=3435888 RepID=UPI003F8688CB
MNVLVLSGDIWHPSEIIKKNFTDLFGADDFKNKNIKVDYLSNLTNIAWQDIAKYKLIILAKSNHCSETNQQPWLEKNTAMQLVNHIKQGNNLFVVHSGLDGYDQHANLSSLIGASFVQHPEQCEVEFKVTKQHGLGKKIKNFTSTDEHYFLNITNDDLSVLAYTISTHGKQLGAWTRKQGQGKVAVMVPSHNQQAWHQVAYQQNLAQLILWLMQTNVH